MNNTSRSSAYGIIAILLLLVVGVLWFYSSRSASGKSQLAQKTLAIKQAKSMASMPVTTPSDFPKIPKQGPNAYTNTNGLVFARLPRGTFSAPFQAEIFLLNANLKLDLSSDQIKILQGKYSSIVLKRLEIEANVAQITKTSDTTYEVVVPAYKDEGIELRNALIGDIVPLLADINKEYLINQVENFFDNSNYNWGITPQKLTIKYEPASDSYEVDHKADALVPLGNENLLVGDGTRKARVEGKNLSNYYFIIRKILNAEN